MKRAARAAPLHRSRATIGSTSMAQVGMFKQVVIFGLVGGVLVTLLQWTEFHFVVLEHSIAIYGALVAVVFAGAGIWLGTRLLAPRERVVKVDRVVEVDRTVDTDRGSELGRSAQGPSANTAAPAASAQVFTADDLARERLGITRRELQILQLVARGLSNREIGEALFVSENTVKTHCSRTFDKLGARRRTEAVQRGKEVGLLP